MQVESMDGEIIVARKVGNSAIADAGSLEVEVGCRSGLVSRYLDFNTSSNLENATPRDLMVLDLGIVAKSSHIFGSQDQLDKVNSCFVLLL